MKSLREKVSKVYIIPVIIAKLTLTEIHANVRKGTDIRNETSGNLLEIDVWIPSLNLCFEFQVNIHKFNLIALY